MRLAYNVFLEMITLLSNILLQWEQGKGQRFSMKLKCKCKIHFNYSIFVPNVTISLINDLVAVSTVGLYYLNIMLQLLTSRDFTSNLSPSSLQKYVINVLGAKCVYEYNKKLNLDD